MSRSVPLLEKTHVAFILERYPSKDPNHTRPLLEALPAAIGEELAEARERAWREGYEAGRVEAAQQAVRRAAAPTATGAEG